MCRRLYRKAPVLLSPSARGPAAHSTSVRTLHSVSIACERIAALVRLKIKRTHCARYCVSVSHQWCASIAQRTGADLPASCHLDENIPSILLFLIIIEQLFPPPPPRTRAPFRISQWPLAAQGLCGIIGILPE